MFASKSSGDYKASDRGKVGTALTFLFIGLGAGALVALLFAPQSGEKTRRMIRRKYEDTVEGISEQADELLERGGEWAAAARDTAKETVEAAREKVAPFTKAVKLK